MSEECSVQTNLELLPLLVELLARDGAHLLEVDEAALEDVGGRLGAALGRLDAEEHLVLGRVRDRVAAEGHRRVLQDHVLQRVAQRVRFSCK